MKKMGALLSFLLCSLAIQAMDENRQESTNQCASANVKKNTHIEFILPKYIPYMITLANMLGDVQENIQEISFIPSLELYTSNVHFPELMNLLGDCITIFESKPRYEPFDEKDENAELMRKHRLRVIEDELHSKEQIRMRILNHIANKLYPLDQLVYMLTVIAYFEIPILETPICEIAIKSIIDLFKTNQHWRAKKFIQSLSITQCGILKDLFFEQCPLDVWTTVEKKDTCSKYYLPFTTIKSKFPRSGMMNISTHDYTGTKRSNKIDFETDYLFFDDKLGDEHRIRLDRGGNDLYIRNGRSNTERRFFNDQFKPLGFSGVIHVSRDRKIIYFNDSRELQLNITPYMEGHTLYGLLNDVYPPAPLLSCTIS